MPTCAVCGNDHPLEDLELTFRRPDIVAELQAAERKSRVQENNDLCILDGQRFFVRALLPLPVLEAVEPYNIGLWVEVSQRDFERVYELWDAANQADEPSFEAQVANEIALHPPVLGLAARLSLTGPMTRPVVTLEPAGHPLVGEQVRGITAHRAYEYNQLFA